MLANSMQSASLSPISQPRLQVIADLFELTKPRLTGLVLFTTSIGMWLAPQQLALGPTLFTLLGMLGAVGGVNALNMYLERDVDALMERTQNRPLPAGRMAPRTALVFGLVVAAAGIGLLAAGVNLISALITLMAVVSYVMLYTPLKQFTPSALYVGAVPGALPPLIGWTAAMGTIDLPALVLFGVMFWWQIPHFLAIALFRHDDYKRAGILTLPVVKGVSRTKLHVVIGILILIPVSLLLVPLQAASPLYMVTAVIMGLVFLAVGVQGYKKGPLELWARRLFLVSLLYLTVVFASLLIPAP